MASSKRFSVWRETIRNHPMLIASTAATAGVLLGGFFSIQLLDTSQPRADATSGSLAAAETNATPKPLAETTGSAAIGESVASAECEQQTWPHLSRACTEEYRSKHRAARVVSTDKLKPQTVQAIESPLPSTAANELAAPVRWAPTIASTEPLTPASAALSAVPAQAIAAPPPASAPAVAATADKAASEPASQPTAKAETKEKQAAKKAKRKPKSDRHVPAKPGVDNDDNTVAAYADEGDDEPVVRQRGRSRIVDRRIARDDYDVPAEDGGGRRRVIVVRPDRGGILGGLFGGF